MNTGPTVLLKFAHSLKPLSCCELHGFKNCPIATYCYKNVLASCKPTTFLCTHLDVLWGHTDLDLLVGHVASTIVMLKMLLV